VIGSPGCVFLGYAGCGEYGISAEYVGYKYSVLVHGSKIILMDVEHGSGGLLNAGMEVDCQCDW